MANISEDELDQIKERFELFDKAGDGKIESHQVIDMLRACGLNPLKTDVDKILGESNLKDTKLNMEAFLSVYTKVRGSSSNAIAVEDYLEAFKTFDRDQTGVISAAQLREMLVNLGDTLTEEEAAAITNSQGMVDQDELVKKLISKNVMSSTFTITVTGWQCWCTLIY